MYFQQSVFTIIDVWISNKRKTSQMMFDLLENYFQEGIEVVSSSIGFDNVDVNSCKELAFPREVPLFN